MWQKPYRKLQILTISDLLGGAAYDMPSVSHGTFKHAERFKSTDGKSQKDCSRDWDHAKFWIECHYQLSWTKYAAIASMS